MNYSNVYRMKCCFRIVLLICLIDLFTTQIKAQQNIQFSQYIFNTLSVNPAYAGYKEEWFAQMALRNQWAGLDGAPKTGQLSIDGIFDPQTKKHGAGLQMTSDKLGSQSSASAVLNYALRLQMDDADTRRLSLGLGIGIAQYSINGRTLTTVDDNDEAVPTGTSSNAVPDFRAGVFYTTPDWYVGISALDLFSGSSAIEDYQHSSAYSDYIVRTRHIYFIAGSLHTLSNGLKIKPSIMVREDFKGPTNADFNAMAILNDRLWLGAGYRTSLKVFKKKYQQTNLSSQAAVILIAQFYVNEAFRIGYSYDYATSKLSGYQSGTHELTVGIAFGKASRSTLCSRVF